MECSEIRRDWMTGRWVIIAPYRARRPLSHPRPLVGGTRIADCSFCPGREHHTPPEVMAFREGPPDTPGWRVRVVPNMFPAVAEKGPCVTERPDSVIAGLGLHEVVVESPDHFTHPALMEVSALEEVLLAYRERFREAISHDRVRYVQVFKNHGHPAGSSMDHPHSQIIALPVVPGAVAEEMRFSREHMRENRRSLYDEVLDRERGGDRIVARGAHFCALAPFAPRFPYEIYLLHDLEEQFEDIDEEAVLDLALVLKVTLRAIHDHLENPPYNLYLHTPPSGPGDRDHYRWHLHIVPRLVGLGGFELGSEMGINSNPPEECADALRRAVITAQST